MIICSVLWSTDLNFRKFYFCLDRCMKPRFLGERGVAIPMVSWVRKCCFEHCRFFFAALIGKQWTLEIFVECDCVEDNSQSGMKVLNCSSTPHALVSSRDTNHSFMWRMMLGILGIKNSEWCLLLHYKLLRVWEVWQTGLFTFQSDRIL